MPRPLPPMTTARGANGARWPTPPTIPIIAMRRPLPWRSWQRAEDYYSEGELIWLDADTLIREISQRQKIAGRFRAARSSASRTAHIATRTYSFDDVVKTLNAVAPHDWAAFLHQRLDAVGEWAPRWTALRAAVTGWSITTRRRISPKPRKRAPQSHRPDLFARLHRRARRRN